jgi:two-component system phosphate regulon sensor histidine kinase PhoR
MIILDLRLILLGALVLLALCAGLALWIGYRLARRNSSAESRAKDDLIADLQHQQRAAQQGLRQLAHEVRAPLTTIQTQAEVARTPDMPDEARESALNAIRSEAQRASRLIEDTVELARLDLANADEIIVKPVNLVLVAEEALAQSLPHAEARRIELSLCTDASLPLVPGDADRLKQVFLNLLDNAVKYCRPGDQVEVILKLDMDRITCAVRDTGPGIPQAHLPYLTQRLYRARTDVEGSGLGLAIVEAILRRHDIPLRTAALPSLVLAGCRVYTTVT